MPTAISPQSIIDPGYYWVKYSPDSRWEISLLEGGIWKQIGNSWNAKPFEVNPNRITLTLNRDKEIERMCNAIIEFLKNS